MCGKAGNALESLNEDVSASTLQQNLSQGRDCDSNLAMKFV
jgi:hypothetical protein